MDVDLRGRAAVCQSINAIPNLLAAVQVEKFTLHRQLVTYTQLEVAERIAAVLPQLLKARDCTLLPLPAVEPDGYGGRSIRIPLTDQPWADAEILTDPDAQILRLVGLPTRLPIQDAAVVAAALLAAEAAVRESILRRP